MNSLKLMVLFCPYLFHRIFVLLYADKAILVQCAIDYTGLYASEMEETGRTSFVSRTAEDLDSIVKMVLFQFVRHCNQKRSQMLRRRTCEAMYGVRNAADFFMPLDRVDVKGDPFAESYVEKHLLTPEYMEVLRLVKVCRNLFCPFFVLFSYHDL